VTDEEGSPSGFRIDKSIVRMGFDAVLALVVGTVGFMVYGIHGELRDIKAHDQKQAEAIATIRERMPIDYVRMDLYMRDRQEMRDILNRIDQNVREHRESLGDWQRRNNGSDK